jgi:hypothetical protein
MTQFRIRNYYLQVTTSWERQKYVVRYINCRQPSPINIFISSSHISLHLTHNCIHFCTKFSFTSWCNSNISWKATDRKTPLYVAFVSSSYMKYLNPSSTRFTAATRNMSCILCNSVFAFPLIFSGRRVFVASVLNVRATEYGDRVVRGSESPQRENKFSRSSDLCSLPDQTSCHSYYWPGTYTALKVPQRGNTLCNNLKGIRSNWIDCFGNEAEIITK